VTVDTVTGARVYQVAGKELERDGCQQDRKGESNCWQSGRIFEKIRVKGLCGRDQ
jgi:hypothetical protein